MFQRLKYVYELEIMKKQVRKTVITVVEKDKKDVFCCDLEQWAAKQGYIGKLTEMAKALFKKAPP